MESPFCLRNTYRPRTPRALRVKKTDKGFVYNVGAYVIESRVDIAKQRREGRVGILPAAHRPGTVAG